MTMWNIIRAAGIGAFLMLWASVVWGLVSTTAIFGRRPAKTTSIALHQAMATLGLLLLTTHIVVLVFDRFLPFTLSDVLIPMHASYRPVGVTLGIAAMFIMVFGVMVTSWGRRLMGVKMWKSLHALSIPAFALALVHGLMTGTDVRRPAMWWTYVVSACVVLFLLLVRAFTAGQRLQQLTGSTGESEPAAVAAVGATGFDHGLVPERVAAASVAPSPSRATEKWEKFEAPKRRWTPFAKTPAPIEFVYVQPAAGGSNGLKWRIRPTERSPDG